MGTEYIMGYAGSAAENRARTHGVAFIEIDDGWLASHWNRPPEKKAIDGHRWPMMLRSWYLAVTSAFMI